LNQTFFPPPIKHYVKFSSIVQNLIIDPMSRSVQVQACEVAQEHFRTKPTKSGSKRQIRVIFIADMKF